MGKSTKGTKGYYTTDEKNAAQIKALLALAFVAATVRQ